MLVKVLVKLIELVPLPVTPVSPAVAANVRVPSSTVSVTCSVPPLASTSEIEIALPLALLNMMFVLLVVSCVVGTVFTGASFTGVTDTVAVATLLAWLAAEPSSTWKLMVRGDPEGLSLELV